MYRKLSPFNGYCWCQLGKLSHLGLEQLMGEVLCLEFTWQIVALYSYSYSNFRSVSKSNSIGSLLVDIILWLDHIDTKFSLSIVDYLLQPDYGNTKFYISIYSSWDSKVYSTPLSDPDNDIKHNNYYVILCRTTLQVRVKNIKEHKEPSQTPIHLVPITSWKHLIENIYFKTTILLPQTKQH